MADDNSPDVMHPMNTKERLDNSVALSELSGGLAIVTGGASGIGLGQLVAATEMGMIPVVLDLNEEGMAAAEAQLREAGATDVMTMKCDVSDRAAVFDCAAAIAARFPLVPISYLAANAGFGTPGLLDSTEEELTNGMGVLFWGIIWVMQAFQSQLLEQAPSPCAIVNTASVAGVFPGGGSYGVAKTATITITEAIYQEYQAKGAKHVKCHVVCPGLIKTNIMEAAPDLDEKVLASKDPRQIMSASFGTALKEQGQTPAYLAQQVMDNIADGGFYIIIDDPDSPVNINAVRAQRNYHERMQAGEPPAAQGTGGPTAVGRLTQEMIKKAMAEATVEARL